MVGVEGRRSASHWMLLRLAGTLPDELIAQCRTWLAEGRELDVGHALVHAVLSQRTPLASPDVELLDELLAARGLDRSALSTVELADDDQMPMFGFLPGLAAVDAYLAGEPETDVDESAAPSRGRAEPEDDIDQAVAQAVAAEPDALALWRSWRFPGDGAPWPPPARVYVVEVRDPADLVAVTGRLQTALRAAGEAVPRVEVYPTRAELPGYQRLARAYAALLWSSSEDPGVRIAVLFDEVDPETGPRMSPDHPEAAETEREQLLAYLRRGEPLLVTAARMDDVVDPTLRGTVPMNFLTDGTYIWNEATTYYLERYAMLPDPELVAHIRSRDYVVAEVDGAALHRALVALQEPAVEEPVWTYG
ncbi:hypothetical protein KZZ52_15205 [Dactylosporangium sp. AC04546]|uniref:hypothetical protein n=1 Tax=Dactylosporangium sp. AC04546 TaxID=2862460 RepID=UPI001EE11E7F|nr:hypothetical protein [Dactylosporangium sp. AC04546]WVK86654.1 hypothetical protein KZZ52_15205 [Dactylosporangium sp. AC04546]